MTAVATPPGLEDAIVETRQACTATLHRLARQDPTATGGLPLSDARAFASSADDAARVLAPLSRSGSSRERLVQQALLAAAVSSLDRLGALPVSLPVKTRLCRIFRSFCDPPIDRDRRFRPDLHEHSRALAACALLHRFPAGQLDWEVSGLPRSYLWKMRFADLPRVLRTVATDLQGVRPCFTAHMGVLRYALLFVEIESHRSYYRMAEAMAQQPDIKGLLMASWYHSSETIRVSPHLAWTNRTPLDHGAVLTDIGQASPEDGFLVGNEERRRLFESGRYRPTTGLVIWPRRNLLAWAAAHPEFAAEGGNG